MIRFLVVAALLLTGWSPLFANGCDSASVAFVPPHNWCASSYSCSGSMQTTMYCWTNSGGFSYPGYGNLEIHTTVIDTVYGFLLVSDTSSADSDSLEIWAGWDEWLNHCYSGSATGAAFDYDSESYVIDGEIGGGSDCCECSLWTRKQQPPGKCQLARWIEPAIADPTRRRRR